ncbi:MAG TPA: serine/threonine-protein kinase [Polyangiaceae bacterium]|nr:serine/threonine-protein kinase [Polyangiaceae bacterium]
MSLAFEELSGSLEEVRENLQPEDVESLQSASFRLSGSLPASGQHRRSVTLSASPIQQLVSIDVQHPRDTAVALDLLATVHAKFPRAETPQAPDLGAARDGSAPEPAPGGRATRLHAGLQVDHYRLIRRLGAGYSGEVWQAEVVTAPPGVAVVPGQVVAMKQYFPVVLTRSSDSLRIQQEFRVASELRHENLVSVYDLVLSPSRTFGSFLVMEYVAGDNLKSSIPAQGFDWGHCVQLGRQLCAALVELHSYGALHRDIKPANIIVLPGDVLSIKLLDLGIVSLIGEHGLTEDSVFLGSKHTSAPEQLFGDEIDERADVYALGATLYQCYRGKPLYDEEGPVTAVVRAMLENPRSCEAKPGAGAEEQSFVRFIDRCLALDPRERPASASDCLEQLEHWSR